jgi:hypothetical protein
MNINIGFVDFDHYMKALSINSCASVFYKDV